MAHPAAESESPISGRITSYVAGEQDSGGFFSVFCVDVYKTIQTVIFGRRE